jgi:hypothetical protein
MPTVMAPRPSADGYQDFLEIEIGDGRRKKLVLSTQVALIITLKTSGYPEESI